MATAKKTPAAKTTSKPAAKTAAKPMTKTPAKKAVPAKAAAPKPVKLNQPVNVTRRNGQVAAGKVVKIEDKPNGRWVTVNVSQDKKKPDLVTARASAVTAR